MTTRIPLVPLEGNPDDVQRLIDNGRNATRGAVNVFLAMANHPGLMRHYMPFAGKLLNGGKLPARERELLILRSAHRTDSEYEWVQHVRIGKAAGLTDAEIVAVQAGPDDESWSEADALILRACDEAMTAYRLSDETWAALAERFDHQQLIELLLLPGKYAALAAFINTVGVPVEEALLE